MTHSVFNKYHKITNGEPNLASEYNRAEENENIYVPFPLWLIEVMDSQLTNRESCEMKFVYFEYYDNLIMSPNRNYLRASICEDFFKWGSTNTSKARPLPLKGNRIWVFMCLACSSCASCSCRLPFLTNSHPALV